ncbi:MAG: ATP-dependent helicase [Planctomycetota bacterium]|nr:MAG: ATP-dependent helicase [Planctomycetota bacterium]
MTEENPAGRSSGKRRRRRRRPAGARPQANGDASSQDGEPSPTDEGRATAPGSQGDTPAPSAAEPAEAATDEAAAKPRRGGGGKRSEPEPDANAIPVEDCAFAEYELRDDLVKGLAASGYHTPSPIQAKSLPHALEGRDVVGQARTGTGKTAAFLVPALQMLSDKSGPRVLVVVPTRELAMQVAGEAERLSRHMGGVRSLAVYGGDPMKRQLDELDRDPKVIAATPGRLLDHLSRGTMKLHELDMLVLDEADRMFDLGFREDIAKIMTRAPKRRQTMLYSATLTEEVLNLAGRYMNDPVKVFLAPDKMTVDEVDQSAFRVDPQYKTRLLVEVLKRERPELSIIFTRTKIGADKLAMRLQKKGLKAQELHSGLHQKKRERILADFKERVFPYLIATDVAARGIDIPDVSHVINYDIPENPEDYVHRIGRTARMGKTGRAVTFVTADDGFFLTSIEKLINKVVPPESYDGFVCRDAPLVVEKKDPPKAASYQKTLMGHIRKRPRR